MSTGIYARISDDRKDGAGVGRQLEDGWAVAKKNGWDAEEFCDNDISASRYSKKVRPEYQRLIEAIKEGRINRIVCFKTDRLYRKPRELEDLIDLAEAGKVEILAIHTGHLDLSTQGGRLTARIMAAVDADASDTTSARVLRAKQQSRQLGGYVGGPRPVGWHRVDGKLVPKPNEVALINDAITDILNGASLNDIARQWTRLGLEHPRSHGTIWHGNVVRFVLTNPRHAGLLAYRGEVVGTGDWPAIVNRDDWERVRSLLDYRAQGYHIPRRRSVLTGLLVCGACGTTMGRGRDRGRVVWRCSTGNLHGCGKISITGAIEGFLIEAALRRADGPELQRFMHDIADDSNTKSIIDELRQLEDRGAVLAQSFAMGRIDIKLFEEANSQIAITHDRLQASLAKLTNTSILAPFAGKPGVLRSVWPGMHMDQQRAILQAVLGKQKILPSTRSHRMSIADRVKPVASSE